MSAAESLIFGRHSGVNRRCGSRARNQWGGAADLFEHRACACDSRKSPLPADPSFVQPPSISTSPLCAANSAILWMTIIATEPVTEPLSSAAPRRSSSASRLLEQIAVGPEPDQAQHDRRGLGIDQQQVGPEMAIPIARPIPGQGMVAVPGR